MVLIFDKFMFILYSVGTILAAFNLLFNNFHETWSMAKYPNKLNRFIQLMSATMAMFTSVCNRERDMFTLFQSNTIYLKLSHHINREDNN